MKKVFIVSAFILSIFLILPASFAEPGPWSESMDLDVNNTDEVSIAIDKDSNLNIVYLGKNNATGIPAIIYKNGSNNTILDEQKIDPDDSDDFITGTELSLPKITIDHNNNLHVIYTEYNYETGVYNIKYTNKSVENDWLSPIILLENVDDANIAFDVNNKLNMVYINRTETTVGTIPGLILTNYKLIHAIESNTTLLEESQTFIDDFSYGIALNSPQITIDAQNNLHIIFQEHNLFYNKNNTKYLKKLQNGIWLLPSLLDTGIGPHIAVDKDGNLNLVYLNIEETIIPDIDGDTNNTLYNYTLIHQVGSLKNILKQREFIEESFKSGSQLIAPKICIDEYNNIYVNYIEYYKHLHHPQIHSHRPRPKHLTHTHQPIHHR